MTEHTNHPGSVPGCVICAVRELTEGTPKIWTPNIAGQRVSGAVLAYGTTPTRFNTTIPFVDLLLSGFRPADAPALERVRVLGYGARLSTGLEAASPQTGDILTITFEGMKTARFRGHDEIRQYRDFTVEVRRGHH